MGFYVDEESFAHGQAPVTGILLVNLGTPDAPTFGALRRYLKQFLEDPRVVELPRPLWWLILNGIVLNVRPGRSAAKYRKIWTAEGAPLRVYTRRLGEAVAARLKADCAGPVEVAVGMRYGNPSIAAALDGLRRAGARRLLVLPLYPQYSAATTASTFDAVAEELMTWRWLPELRMISHYHDDPGYLEAVTASILEVWTRQGQPQRLLFSFHGLPRRSLLAGDPYHCECHKTARRVAEALDLEPQRWAVAFQSRFGYAEWLKPYTSELLANWGRQGVKAVDVVCPGFAVDCLETLEEIA
ncbi:MAG: ferrochelatase, partial [Pseudomonadota bacterium]|nr:ferrochelatase [Pseudomonadota bacterium]